MAHATILSRDEDIVLALSLQEAELIRAMLGRPDETVPDSIRGLVGGIRRALTKAGIDNFLGFSLEGETWELWLSAKRST